jgi:ribosomal protein L24E
MNVQFEASQEQLLTSTLQNQITENLGNLANRLLNAGHTRTGRALIGLAYAASPIALGAAAELSQSDVPAAVAGTLIGERPADAQEAPVTLTPECGKVSQNIWGIRATNNTDANLGTKLEMTGTERTDLGTLRGKYTDPNQAFTITEYSSISDTGAPLPNPEGRAYNFSVTWSRNQDGSLAGINYSTPFVLRCGTVGTTPTTSPNTPSNTEIPNDAGGYRLWTSTGDVYFYGNGVAENRLGTTVLNKAIVAGVNNPNGNGYWLVASDGGIFSFGDAKFHGSTGAIKLNQPIVGAEATPSGNGYWLVARDGGIFAFGDAKFQGSTGNIKLNQPIVGMAATETGNGYNLVAADGGIFSFGDAKFQGSTGNIKLNQPIVGMANNPKGNGYWLVARDGGIFAFGEAPFMGSTGAIRLNQPIVGMAATAEGKGYRFVAADGGIFSFGDAPFFGSAASEKKDSPIVGMDSNPQR